MPVYRGQSALAAILEKGMSQITEEEIQLPDEKWLGKSKVSSAISLTWDEEKWLNAHPVILVSNETDYAPFDYVENGQPTGFSIDYLRLLAYRMGIRLEFVQDTWGNLLEKCKRREIDLLLTMNHTKKS